MAKTKSQLAGWLTRPAEVDDVDMKILRLLRGDARLSARAIGRHIGMSPGAVSERISRLEREGVIVGYFAEIDSARLGMGMLAIVGVQVEHDSKLVDMVEQLLKLPECDRVYVVTGEWDLLVFLRVRDQHHLAEVLFSDLWKTQGFRHSETMIVLDRESVPYRSLIGYSELKRPVAAPEPDGRRPALASGDGKSARKRKRAARA